MTIYGLEGEGEMDDYDPPLWLCPCGHFEESEFHCSRCGNEPPWGCDCGMHDDEDCDDEFIYYDPGGPTHAE